MIPLLLINKHSLHFDDWLHNGWRVPIDKAVLQVSPAHTECSIPTREPAGASGSWQCR